MSSGAISCEHHDVGLDDVRDQYVCSADGPLTRAAVKQLEALPDRSRVVLYFVGATDQDVLATVSLVPWITSLGVFACLT